jgi:urea transport system ATP-binding protein
MLELANVGASYGQVRALSNVSFKVGSGELVAVLGRNGVGKTSLLRTILGLMDRITGTVRLDGEDLTARRTDQRARAGIGYVPQGRGILPRFSVLENLRLGVFANGARDACLDESVFDLFPVLKQHLRWQGGNLSGGQQQQLAIARALQARPKVILMDEPTEGIQPNIVEDIERIILRLNRERGLTIVLVEQNVAFTRRAAQRFLIMEKGSIAVEGAAGELSDQLVHRYMAV